jgi:hypothetical protein
MLVDRAIQVRPVAGDLDVGLVDQPPVAGGVAARSRRVDELRREGLNPPVDRYLVDLNTALGEQLLDVAVGQVVMQIPADCDRNHLTGKWTYAGAGSQAAGSRVTL